MATEKELDKSFDDLMIAVAKYVELRGGKALVAGSVQVIKFPGDLTYNWTLGIRCTGNPPVIESAQQGVESTVDGQGDFPPYVIRDWNGNPK